MPSDEFDEHHRAVLEVLQEGARTPKYIGDQIGKSGQFVNGKLKDLRFAGDVEKIDTGLYELAEGAQRDDDTDPFTMRTADDDLVDALQDDEFDLPELTKSDDRVRAIAVVLTRIRHGARLTVREVEDAREELGIDLGESSWRKAVNAAVDHLDEFYSLQTMTYFANR